MLDNSTVPIYRSSWLETNFEAVGVAIIIPPVSWLFILFKVYGIMGCTPGHGKMVEIADIILEGSIAFMKRQYQVITFFTFLCAIVIVAILRSPENPFDGHAGGMTDEPYWVMMIHFLVGSGLSALSGVCGMNVAIRANVRTTAACNSKHDPLNKGLRVAFDSGTVMGLSVVSFVVFGQAVLYIIFEDPLALSGFGFGASLVALFARVGGGIFTKAADVGSDLVGKIEAGIPEDDPRNPGVIADNVGDNVGDVAGLGADLFESFVGATVAAVPLGWNAHGISGIALPFWISAAGILCSIVGTLFVRTQEGANQSQLLAALRRGTLVTAFLVLVSSFFICYFLFDDDTTVAWYLFICLVAGLIAGMFVGFITEYSTSSAFIPTKSIINASVTGSATVIIQGIAVGMLSTTGPGIVLAFTALLCALLEGPYGVSIAAIGMLSTLGITLATDAYGPVADNAGGIAEMAGLPEEVRERTDALDALGNTTAATGKGFAIGSALLITLALISAFIEETGIDVIDMTDPLTLTGALIGALLPFMFAALTMFAVSRSAQALIHEIRDQFRNIEGLLEGKEGVKADYKGCVDLCTRAALIEMILPGMIAVFVPIGGGFSFGSKFLGGLLIGSILSGFFLGTSMANSGGAWDNAKKAVEAEPKGDQTGKGSERHTAVVVGDTVGDPFKDTSGPALNILCKLMSHLSLIISGSLSVEWGDTYPIIGIWIAIVVLVLVFVCWRLNGNRSSGYQGITRQRDYGSNASSMRFNKLGP